MEALILVVLIVQVVLHSSVFHYQRFTLDAARRILVDQPNPTKRDIAEVQTWATPSWIGTIGWITTSVGLVLVPALWLTYGWVAALLFVAWNWLAGGMVDGLWPFPSQSQCARWGLAAMNGFQINLPSSSADIMKMGRFRELRDYLQARA